MSRIVLGYSGGLATSIAIPWLAERFTAEVVAVALDLGQGQELVEIRERALAAGAVRCHVLDVREEFVRDFILPSLQAGVIDERRYSIARVLAHSLIAKKLVEIARMEGATAIAHGCAGTGGDALRFEESARALEPSITVIAPAYIWNLSGASALEYARARSISVSPNVNRSFHSQSNLWGRSIEVHELDDRVNKSIVGMYTLTRLQQDCPDEPAYVEVEFKSGVPTGTNGIEMPPIELVESLELIAGAHGVGRIAMAANSMAGGMSREICEAPAGVVLHAAHAGLEELVLSPDLEQLKRGLSRAYADLIYNGLWFSHTRQAIDAFVAAIQPRVSGSIRLKLVKGDCRVVSRTSPFARHDHGLAAEGASDVFGQSAASLSKN